MKIEGVTKEAMLQLKPTIEGIKGYMNVMQTKETYLMGEWKIAFNKHNFKNHTTNWTKLE